MAPVIETDLKKKQEEIYGEKKNVARSGGEHPSKNFGALSTWGSPMREKSLQTTRKKRFLEITLCQESDGHRRSAARIMTEKLGQDA